MCPTSPVPALRISARGRSHALLIVIVLMATLALPGATRAADSVYWTNPGLSTISHASLDGSGGADLATGAVIGSEPAGVAIDTAAGRLYWADRSSGRISYTNLDGSGGSNLLLLGTAIERPSGIAIDPAAGRIYWADSSLEAISYANLDGSGGGALTTTGATVKRPEGVAIDPAAGRIYWANREGNAISYASLDGSGGADLVTGGATVEEPIGPAIDPAAGRIYWANLGNDTISYANLGGSGGADLVTGGATVKSPAGVAIDAAAGRIYWVNAEAPTISYASLDGSGGGDLAVAGASFGESNLPSLLEAPSAAGAPEISGQGLIERPLFCSQGKWAPDLLSSLLYRAPTSLTYSWLHNGETVPGATESTYRPTKPGTYGCRVTASNQAGATAQTSADLTLMRGIALADRFVPVHGRRALLTLHCVGNGRCKGKVKLIAHIGYSRVVHHDGHREVIRRRALFPIGKSSFSIFPGRTRVIYVKLKRKGKQLLHNSRGKQLRARLLGRDVDHSRVLLKAKS